MADNRHSQPKNRKIYLTPKYKLAMSVLILLIACSILIAGGFLVAFIWSVKKGQYDDDYTPSVRMLFDDKPVAEKNSSSISKPK